MTNPRFARWVFRIAGIYGLLVILPGYFTERAVGREYPPAITHREYYYGFLGVTVAWQIAFLVISTNPVRYRPLMLVAIVEKLGFFVPGVILFMGHEIPPPAAAGAAIDLVIAVMFALAYWRTARRPDAGKIAPP
jgi:hypothetical protein